MLNSTPSLITWKTGSFVSMLKQAEACGQTVAIVHNHPSGIINFSAQDDANELDLTQLAVNRNGIGTNILSVILTVDGQLAGGFGFSPLRRLMSRCKL